MTAIRVSGYQGGSPTYGVPVYWLVESLTGEALDEVVVGVVPDGFLETVPLRVAPPDDDLVKLSGIDEAGGFSTTLGKLKVGRVRTGGYDDVTEADFRAFASRACGGVITLAFLTFAVLPLAVVASSVPSGGPGNVATLATGSSPGRAPVRWPCSTCRCSSPCVPTPSARSGSVPS